MWIYYILFILIYVFLIAENSHNSKVLFVLLGALIFSIIAFRDYSVGSDTMTYIEEYFENSSFARGIDMGYAAYTSFLNSIGMSSRLFLILTSFIIFFPYFLYTNNCVGRKLLTLFLYVTIGTFSMHMSGIRQSMAMGIALLGYVISIKISKQFLKYLILAAFVVMSSTIHKTAIICFLFIPMIMLSESKISLGKNWRIILVLLPIVAIFLSSVYAPLVDYFMVYKYENYEFGAENINIISFFIIPYTVFLYITWLKYRFGLENNFHRFAYICAIVSVLCASASLYMPILSRIAYYFDLPVLGLISDSTYKLPAKERGIIVPLLIIVCTLFFMVSVPGGILKIDNYHLSI